MTGSSKWTAKEAAGSANTDFPDLGTQPEKKPGPAKAEKAEGGTGKTGWRQVVLERVRYQESKALKEQAESGGYPEIPPKGKGKGREKGFGKKGDGKGPVGYGKGKGGEKGEGRGRNYGDGDDARDGWGSYGFVGDWVDSLGNAVVVSRGNGSRGPLTTTLIRGDKEQILSLRRDPSTGLWACGNAFLDPDMSNKSRLVWATYDGRRSVWRREGSMKEDELPADLLPWLLNNKAGQMPRGGVTPKAPTRAVDPGTRRRMKDRWGTAESSDEEEEGAEKKEKLEDIAEKEEEKQEEEAEEAKEAEAEKEPEKELSRLESDGARVSLILDVRQVLGHDRAAQEILTSILMDHDILKKDEEDFMIPAADSPLWERLPEAQRKNALLLLAPFHAHGCVVGCAPEHASNDFTEMHVGRHRFAVSYNDVQALLKRWTGPKETKERNSSMAHVLALYRALDSPLMPEGERGSFQLCWDPTERKKANITHELFASPFNARVEAGKYGSRWPHVETQFGSAGRYPEVIGVFPEDAVVSVNPPFSEAYLDHLMGGPALEQIVTKFKEVHLFTPVREAAWRPQLHRLQGATFVKQFWDSSALKECLLTQPVLYWSGGELKAL